VKQLFQSLSRTNDGAFIIDSNHRIIFWNQAAQEILGYTVEEAVGRMCYEILGGRDGQGRTLCQRYCRMAIQADRGDILPNKDVFTHSRTGKGCWLNVTTFAYPIGDKPLDRLIVHLFRDATEQKNYQNFAEQVLSASTRLQKSKGQPNNGSDLNKSQVGVLTAREQQVLELLAQAQSTKEIAGTLTISPSTVRNHVQNILHKLGVHSRLEAIAFAYQHGFITSDEL
jgi:PAS domain S-box-containing protein